MTSPLTIKDYPFHYDFQAHIQKVVNKEAEIMHPHQPTPLPKYQKTKVEKLNAGVWNMVRQMLP